MDRAGSRGGRAGADGKLFYVMGASGAGKDTLLRHARGRLDGGSPVLFAHRYITREPDPAREDFVALTEAEFAQRAAAGLFALQWRSHGCRYGIGVEVDRWLAAGFRVVVNGSRRSLADARRRYPDLVPVLLKVGPVLLRQRRLACGRTDRDDPDGTLDREVLVLAPDCARVTNDGTVAEAGDALLAILTRDLDPAVAVRSASGAS